jgi:nucleotide-binding universal stress UspA family protein
MLPIKTILHPTDFSDTSEQALRIAEGLARDYGARLILMHAVEPMIFTNEIAMDVSATQRYREDARERISGLLEPGSPLAVETELVDGVAAIEINRVAAERQCDLIVIGSHGRSGLGRVLMGSVAEEVARKAPCPVLIVRSPAEPSRAPTAASPTSPAP